jgi:hypothetical protein
MPDDEQRIALLYGPLVLAADLGPAEDSASMEPDYVPIILTENRNPSAWLIPTGTNTFEMTGVGHPRNVVFKPFYKTHDRSYSVYLDMFNNQQWAAHQQAYQKDLEEEKALEAVTFELFNPGEMQSERDHQFKGDSIFIQELKGRKSRGSNRGGWFSFDMKVAQEQPMALVVEYWGGFTGSKTFDILVNDQKIGTENISGIKDGEYLNITYPIPESLTATTKRITVRFQPHVGHRAGPIFKVRTVRHTPDA